MLGSLNGWTWHHSVARFARENALPADYIDNCWVRVAMNADQLTQFLTQDEASAIEAADLIEKVRPDLWYVVSEEEF
ncbi:MAG: hypothetical protein ACOYLS_08760 [Polymorphobacter sp.]